MTKTEAKKKKPKKGTGEAPRGANFGEKSLLSVTLERRRGWEPEHIEEDWRRFAALNWPSPLTDIDAAVHSRGHEALRAYLERLACRLSHPDHLLERHPGSHDITNVLAQLRQLSDHLSKLKRNQIALLAEIIANGQLAMHGNKDRSKRLSPSSMPLQLLALRELSYKEGQDALTVVRPRGAQPNPMMDQLLDDLATIWTGLKGGAPSRATGYNTFKGFFGRLVSASRISLAIRVAVTERDKFLNLAPEGPSLDQQLDLASESDAIIVALPRAVDRFKLHQAPLA